MIEVILIIGFGMLIGSFLNVCIIRIPEGQSIIFPRSHCMNCGHTLGITELIPVFSYLSLRGRCKKCHVKITSRYLWIELLTGIGFGIIYSLYGMSIETIIDCTFLAFAIVLTMIDWEHMILPSSIISWGIMIGLLENKEFFHKKESHLLLLF